MLGILHLSDIHFVSGPNPVSSKIKAIQGAVQSESHDIDELLLVISGDVAYSGKQAEYSIAIEFVSDLEKSIRAIPALNFLGTVVIPGNHDLDFDNEGSVRPALLTTLNDTVGSLEADSDFVEQMTKPQNGFFNFQGLVSPGYKPASRLFWAQELSSKQGKILIRCFNTSWVSRKKEAAGQIIFPTQLVTSTDSENDAALVLSVFHHPYGWFNPDNGKTFRRMIETTSDVVLTGHEHDIDAYTKITNLGGTINYVEGAALQASGVQTGFNLLKVDLHACVYQSRPFEWQKDIFVPGSLASSVFARNQSLLEHQFVNNQEFKKQLDDIGTPFTHPVKVELTLSDVFVYPDLKVSSVAPKAGRETVVMSAEVLEYVSGNPLVSIAGAPTSGKTSLGKMLYMDMQQRKKLVPIFLTQDDIRGSSSSQVHAAIERAFERQYSKRMLNRFMQLEPEAKVVIFDDWHKMKLNSKGKALVVEALCKQFGRVIVLTDDASVLNQVADAVSSGELPHFLYCEIKQFGYRLRGELVTRWATLGREFDSEELEVSHRISSGEYLLDTLIGKGIVPAFPFFIISALQIESANQPAPYGSYGHIYQALLTTRMARVNSRNLNLKFAFLSLVAIEIFRAGHGAVSPSQLKTIHEKYEKEYAISADFKRIVEELELAQVLSITGDEVRLNTSTHITILLLSISMMACLTGRKRQRLWIS